ncbi:MAG: asparaginase domain-containing protein [Nanoarchaeota archaeon]
MSQKVHFIFTGGTIDSFWDGPKDTATPYKSSQIPFFLKQLQLFQPHTCTEICMKDSRSMGKKDILKILKCIKKSPHKKVIITHGTYTMPETGRFLKAHLPKNDKVIILTGSMVPLVGFSPSDAGFNLGYSLAKVNELPPGIYICMNGRVFKPEDVLKTLKEGRFSSIMSI